MTRAGSLHHRFESCRRVEEGTLLSWGRRAPKKSARKDITMKNCLGLEQKQVPDRRRISNRTTLTLTLSRPKGEGTARPDSRGFKGGWIRRPTGDDSPSPIRYLFTVGSTGDSPVPSGDPPDGTERGIERTNAVFSHSGYTTTPPGESPGGAGGSPAPPSVNRYPIRWERAGVRDSLTQTRKLFSHVFLKRLASQKLP